MSEDDGERTLGILPGESVGICFPRVSSNPRPRVRARCLTRVADTSVVDLNADLVSLGGRDLNILNAELLASLPGDGGLAGDGLGQSVFLLPLTNPSMKIPKFVPCQL